jgi:hypothetical protein
LSSRYKISINNYYGMLADKRLKKGTLTEKR